MFVAQEKILPIDALSQKVAELKKAGKKVVMCHGVFDLVHIGHIKHFGEARKFGDLLVVTLTPDRYVNKGAHRPVFTEALRAEAVAALGIVDFVAINKWPTAVEALKLIHPDIYCKGSEYKTNQVDAESNMLPEVSAAQEAGIQIEYTEDIVFSSSTLLNQHFSQLPEDTEIWLKEFRDKYALDQILEYLENVRSLKVLVVGEAIIDEYVFCDTIGKSTKDPVLACQYIDTEVFAGGSLAIANHLAGFCDHVGIITCLGDTERQERFVRNSLLPNIQPTFVTKESSPTIHKRRFVDKYSQNKLFELYIMDDQPICGKNEEELNAVLQDALNDYDVVIAADYGHGMLTSSSVAVLCEYAKFLSVNTQSNAGNRGFNPVSKYNKADYVCLAKHEISIETRMREGNLEDLLMDVISRIDCQNFTVTRGKDGSLHYDTSQGFTEVPAFASRVSDRVGAGDAVLALTSLLVSQNVPWDIVGFIGNVAGGMMVTDLGNRFSIQKIPLSKSIISLLK